MIESAHDKATCWNPQFHGPFRKAAAAIFAARYLKEYYDGDPKRFAAVPLCVFGGAVTSSYTCTEKSLGGTYAVCGACDAVKMCGWGMDGVTKACDCGRTFTWGDYFQPAVTGLEPSSEQLRKLIDPAKDPAVAIAELCAPFKDGIPSAKIAPLIVILTAQGMLRTGHHLDYALYELRKSGMESDQVREAVSSQRWTWVDPTATEWNVRVSKHGRALLEARSIRRDSRAVREIERLLGHEKDRLKYESVSKLAAMLMP